MENIEKFPLDILEKELDRLEKDFSDSIADIVTCEIASSMEDLESSVRYTLIRLNNNRYFVNVIIAELRRRIEILQKPSCRNCDRAKMEALRLQNTSSNKDYATALYKLLDEMYYDGETTDAKIVAGVEAIQRLNAMHIV